MHWLIKILLGLLVSLSCSALFGATVTWEGGAGNGLWSDPLNWDGDTLPVSTDLVLITGTTGSVTLDVDFTVEEELEIGTSIGPGTDVLEIPVGRTLTIDGDQNTVVVMTMGTLNIEGTVTILDGELAASGLIHVMAGGAINGGLLESANDTGTITNDGTVNVSTYAPSRGVLNNNASFTANGVATHPSVPSTINNTGTLTATSSLQIRFRDDVVINSGTINNNGSAESWGFVDNTDGTINNNGTWTNKCDTIQGSQGDISGGSLTGNPIIEECKVWDNDGGDGLWSNPLNWSLDTTPAGTKRIIIDGERGSDTVVHLDTDFITSQTIQLGDGFSTLDTELVIDATRKLTSNGTFLNRFRHVTNNGTLENNGTFEHQGHGNLGPGIFDNHGLLTNVGTFYNGGSSGLGHGEFTNHPTGTIDNSGTFTSDCESTFVENGTVIGTPVFEQCIIWDGEAGTSLWSAPLNWSTDTLPVPGNEILINGTAGPVTLDIDFTVEGSIELGTSFGPGTDVLDIPPGRTLTIDGGQNTVVVMTMGTLNIEGVVTILDGELAASGLIHVMPGGAINGGLLESSNDTGTITNDGTVNVQSYAPSRGVLNNNASFTASGVATHPSVPSTINNTGTLTATSSLQIRFRDDVVINSGTINNNGTAENSGFVDNTGGTINNNGTWTNICDTNQGTQGDISGGSLTGNPINEECKIWDNDGGDGLWSNPLNWSLDTAPVSSSRILIDGERGSDTEVHLDSNFTISNSLQLGTGFSNLATSFYIDPGVTLEIDPSRSLRNRFRSLINNGEIVNHGTLSIEGHGNLGPGIFENNGPFTNHGAFNNGTGATPTEITNAHIIDNQGSFEHNGSFDQFCGGIFTGTPLTGATTIVDTLCIPILLVPANEATTAQDQPIFLWSNPSERRSVEYDWLLSQSDTPVDMVTTGLTSHMVGAPLALGSYQWQVVARLLSDPSVTAPSLIFEFEVVPIFSHGFE
jgi:hypothetical protein